MRRWYAIQATSGREASVKRDIEARLANFGQTHNLGRVVVPTETRIEEKAGQKREVQFRPMPGYVFAQVNLTDEVWSAIRNTKGVIGFLGAGDVPTPLSDDEVRRLIGVGAGAGPSKSETKVAFNVGDTIEVKQGHPLAGFQGDVVEVKADARKLFAETMIFERAVRTEFSFDQVERVGS